MLREVHGQDGAPLAQPLRMLADVQRELGDCAAAREGYRAALAILDPTGPDEDVERARAGLQACHQAG